jgi:hypothetical protein
MSIWTDPQLDQLAAKFFREFSRMEYALKATHYLNARDTRNAKADWEKFGKNINDSLMNSGDETVKVAVEYMLNSPPKKQVVKGGNLDWDNTPPTASTEGGKVLLCVCRVRNNLFHGGKFNGKWFAPERSGILIEHSLTILRACRDFEEDVKKAYND